MARYELVEGTSRKFWEVTIDGASLTTRWGRIGTEGQSKTKVFGDAAAARKEHDKLVREKVGKGYAAVEEGARPAAASLRTDLSVYNEATAFMVFSEAMIGRRLSPDHAAWEQAIDEGDLLPFELVQDDPFVIRVVFGDALTPVERDEAIGSLAWKLRVPDGKLVIAGGIELVMEEVGSPVSDYLKQYAHHLNVPAGEYAATLLAYVHGVNGGNLLDRARGPKGEGVGAWFRRSRSGEMPVWVRSWCHADPREDRGHEDDWADEPTRRERAKEESTAYVDFLLHLEPIGAAPQTRPPLEQRFFSFDAYDVRLPERCPVGILAKSPRSREPEPSAAPAEPQPLRTLNVLARVRNRTLAKVDGGPVDHPIQQLVDVYRLAWFATEAADPEIRIELPKGISFTPSWPAAEGRAVTIDEGLVRIGFGETAGRWGQLHAVQSITKSLGDLPDGSIVELLTSPGQFFWERDDEDDPEQDPDAGVQRYRGAVRGGSWLIDQTFPAVDAATLREALTLSVEVLSGRKLSLRDEDEGPDVQRRLEAESFLFTSNPIVLKGLQIGLSKKDASLLHFVAIALFRARWGSVWPCYQEDEDANAEFDKAMKALSEAMAAKLTKAAAPKGDLELVLEGRIGRFDKVDLARERRLEENLIEESDRQLRELGYRVVGDLVCSRFPDVIVRGYAREGGDTWGAYLAGVLESSFEFVTQFEKDAGLTTTFKAGPPDEPAKGLYRSRHPKLNFRMLKRLHEQHESRKKALGGKLGAPLPTPVDLVAFAQAVDEGVSRQLSE
jgi:predicted DNA-binding WGR domain protein